jgi:hypothetical protein
MLSSQCVPPPAVVPPAVRRGGSEALVPLLVFMGFSGLGLLLMILMTLLAPDLMASVAAGFIEGFLESLTGH